MIARGATGTLHPLPPPPPRQRPPPALPPQGHRQHLQKSTAASRSSSTAAHLPERGDAAAAGARPGAEVLRFGSARRARRGLTLGVLATWAYAHFGPRRRARLLDAARTPIFYWFSNAIGASRTGWRSELKPWEVTACATCESPRTSRTNLRTCAHHISPLRGSERALPPLGGVPFAAGRCFVVAPRRTPAPVALPARLAAGGRGVGARAHGARDAVAPAERMQRVVRRRARPRRAKAPTNGLVAKYCAATGAPTAR